MYPDERPSEGVVQEETPQRISEAEPPRWRALRAVEKRALIPEGGYYGMVGADEYRAVFDSLPDGILIVDDEGLIRDLNARIERLFG